MSTDSFKPDSARLGIAGRIARAFIDSKLTPLLVITSILLGAASIVLLPREEEPQIKVPMIDVMVTMPGATPQEVQERLTIPMEKLLYELPGVEYIYSTSMAGQTLLIVRFYVGEDLETSIVRLNQKLETNFDRIPHSISRPLIKPHTIDDVPILALTLHGADLAVVRTLDRPQPVFCLCRRQLLPSLTEFFDRGGRKADDWQAAQKMVEVAFDDQAEAFTNINTRDELGYWEEG